MFSRDHVTLKSIDLVHFVPDGLHLIILLFYILSLYLKLGLEVGELTPEFGNLLKFTHT